MKVLFAVSNEKISETVIKLYQREYKEIISAKNVYYFNAIQKELQMNNIYDVIVISEDLEPFTNNNYDAIDRFIFDRLDRISDEATNSTRVDTPIVFICSDRRKKSEDFLVKLFSIGIYDALVGNDRSISNICNLIKKPRTKKEAKIYYNIESDEVKYTPEDENEVSEVEIQNILNHYKKLGKNEKQYAKSFESIAAQYNEEQLKVIANILPINIKAVLETTSPTYQKVMTSSVGNFEKNNENNGLRMNFISNNKKQPINGNIVIPSAINSNAQKVYTSDQPDNNIELNQNVNTQPTQNNVNQDFYSNNNSNNNGFDAFEPVNNNQTNNQFGNDNNDNNNGFDAFEPVNNNQADNQFGNDNNDNNNGFDAFEPVNNNQTNNQFEKNNNSNNNEFNSFDEIDNLINSDLNDNVKDEDVQNKNEIINNLDENLKNAFDEDNTNINEMHKRGRGRPRKNPPTTENNEAPKRKRGRPRKNPLPTEIDNFDQNNEDNSLNNLEQDINELSNFELENNNDWNTLPNTDQENNNNDWNTLPNAEPENNNDWNTLANTDQENNNDWNTLPNTNQENNNDWNTLPNTDQENNNDWNTLPNTDQENNNDWNTLPNTDQENNSNDWNTLPNAKPENNSDWNTMPEAEPQDNSGWNTMPEAESQDNNGWNTMPGAEPQDNNGWNTMPGEEPQDNNGWNTMPGAEPQDDNGWNTMPGAEPQDNNDWNAANNNGYYNEPNNIENNEIMNTIQNDSTIQSLLTLNKKLVSFVGTSKNGTSFIVNNVAHALAESGINVAILDTTRNKNSYYIYTQNEENLRKIAADSIKNLQSGVAKGLNANRNLTVYTSVPEDNVGIENYTSILQTLIQNHDLILIDCDFSTHFGYFLESQEIYLVQSPDVLTIQPLTAFLRDLKTNNILNQEKIRIVLNKSMKVRGLTDKAIIGGMSFYNEPAMSFMTELFNRDNVKYCSIPFEQQTYSKYLEGLVNCKISLSGYSKEFMQYINVLCNMVYPLINDRQNKRR